MLTSSKELQNRSFHVIERTRTSSKCRKLKNPRAKRAVFHCQICKSVGFLLPSSSWLLRLTNVAKRFVKGEGEATLHEGKEQNLHQGRKLVIFMCLNVCPRLYVTTGFVLYCLRWVATIVAVKHLGALDSRARTKTRSGTKHSVFATTKSSNFFVFNYAGTAKVDCDNIVTMSKRRTLRPRI